MAGVSISTLGGENVVMLHQLLRVRGSRIKLGQIRVWLY